MEKTIPASLVLGILASQYNNNAEAAAYWRAADHPAYTTSAHMATALFGAIQTLGFKRGVDYEMKFVICKMGSFKFDYQKMEVL